jgi:hypothetical protein
VRISAMLVSFPLLWQTSGKVNLKEERFSLACGFRGFSTWSLGSVFSGPVGRQNIMAGFTWQRRQQGERKGVRERDR